MSNRWIKYKKEVKDAKCKLICLPYAGAGASKFANWHHYMEDDIEVIPIQFPERENRLGEKNQGDFFEVLQQIIAAILPSIEDSNFAIFGHSMGGVFAYELCKTLQNEFSLIATQCFISASYIHLCEDNNQILKLEREDFIAEIKKMGGISEELLEYPDFRDLFINTIRSDFKLMNTYQPPKEPIKLEVPIRTYFGLKDPIVKGEDVELWSEYTKKEYTNRSFSGDHFFFLEDVAAVCQDIKSYLL